MPPSLLPDVTALPKPPQRGEVGRWVTAWRGVRFRRRGQWWIGVLRGWIQLADGRWVAQIEYGQEGMHPSHPHVIWAVYDRRLIVPIEAEPPSRQS